MNNRNDDDKAKRRLVSNLPNVPNTNIEEEMRNRELLKNSNAFLVFREIKKIYPDELKITEGNWLTILGKVNSSNTEEKVKAMPEYSAMMKTLTRLTENAELAGYAERLRKLKEGSGAWANPKPEQPKGQPIEAAQQNRRKEEQQIARYNPPPKVTPAPQKPVSTAPVVKKIMEHGVTVAPRQQKGSSFLEGIWRDARLAMNNLWLSYCRNEIGKTLVQIEKNAVSLEQGNIGQKAIAVFSNLVNKGIVLPYYKKEIVQGEKQVAQLKGLEEEAPRPSPGPRR